MKVLIGIDDTDIADSPGTGQLARRVAGEIHRAGGRPLGITRHQFLMDPRIAYTGHNRGICVGIEWEQPLENLDFVFGLVKQWSSAGSDPRVCIAAAESVNHGVMIWGERAMRDVLTMAEAVARAGESGLL